MSAQFADRDAWKARAEAAEKRVEVLEAASTVLARVRQALLVPEGESVVDAALAATVAMRKLAALRTREAAEHLVLELAPLARGSLSPEGFGQYVDGHHRALCAVLSEVPIDATSTRGGEFVDEGARRALRQLTEHLFGDLSQAECVARMRAALATGPEPTLAVEPA